MPHQPNKLSQFWQELKRRKVVRVITVYAAAAFVILELVDIIADPLKLPEWFLTAVIVFLCIGFIIAVILSWIYDVHPEGGMVKTEPADKVKQAVEPKSSNSWKIASYISFVVIVALIVLNIIPRTNASKEAEILDKSVAVIPFIDDSPDKNNEHIINGIMEDLLINLQSIKELRVPGRTSTEQYRDNPKPIPEIASELNVAYIVEGSGQRYGNKIRLRVQLLEGATDRHLWADSYDEVINGPEDIFRIQSQIAKSIAAELQAVISPEEMKLIEKIPTYNMTAYDLFMQGREEHNKYWNNVLDDKDALNRVEHLYLEALEYDSTFAQAYSGLAFVFQEKSGSDYFSETYLDSTLILADKALSFDDQLSEAYVARALYYFNNGNIDQAIKEIDHAIKVNPNDWDAYDIKGQIFSERDVVISIQSYIKAISIHRGVDLPYLLNTLGSKFLKAGFPEKASRYYEDAFKLDGDSMMYYSSIATICRREGNYKQALGYALEAYSRQQLASHLIYWVMYDYVMLGKFEESLEYCNKYINRMKALGYFHINTSHSIGYILSKTGDQDLADSYFQQQIEYCNENIKKGRNLYWGYFDRAGVYAYQGKKTEALEDLMKFSQKEKTYFGMVTLINDDPLFDSIRDEPEFQQILRDVEAKYQAEHERVRQWLEDNDML